MPSATAKPRQALKARFVRGMIPTDTGFIDLIDAQLNQADDGVIKPPNESLILVRQTASQPVVRFFEDPNHTESTWQLYLAAEDNPGLALANNDGLALFLIDQATGHVGVSTPSPAARLTVHSEEGISADGVDPQSNLLYQGIVAIKAPSPQLDFIDTDGPIDWAIHEENGHLSFINSSSESRVLHLDGNTGHVGIGTEQPTQKLHVNGIAAIKTLLVDALWISGKPLAVGGPLGSEATELANGNVGIGEREPAARFVVSSKLEPEQTPKDPRSRLAYGGQLTIKAPTPQLDFIVVNPGYNQNGWAINLLGGDLSFVRPFWDSKDLFLSARGNVGMGTNIPTSKLHVSGKARFQYITFDGKWRLGSWKKEDYWLRVLDPRLANYDGSSKDYFGGFAAKSLWSSQGFAQGSDLRLKVQGSIRAIREGLSRVLPLRPIEFRYKSNPGRKNPLFGFLAQDVEAPCPEAVVQGPDGMKGLDQGCLVALLVLSVKEQQARIDSLRAQLASRP
jgi:hypothetical protein